MKRCYYKPLCKLIFVLTFLTGFTPATHAQVLVQDSLALVDLYNSTAGSHWANHNSWLSGNVTGWYGITVKNNRVSKIVLPANNLTGSLPASLLNLDSLLVFNISGNNADRLPNLTGLPILDTLLVNQNELTFRDLQPNNTAASRFVYSPQDSVETTVDTLVLEQSTFVMRVNIDTEAGILDQFQWYKNGDSITGATARAYTLLCFDSTQAGLYTCRIKNNIVSGLSLWRYPVNVRFLRLANAGADISVCDSIGTLIGNAPVSGTGFWTLISGSGVITHPDSAITTITQLGSGANLFRWNMSNNALCASSHDYVVITRDLPPSLPNASADVEICTTQVQMNGNTPASGTGTWTVISGTGVVAQPTSPNSVVNGLSLGDNILRWQIFSGVCAPSIFDEIKIYVADTLQTANAGPDFSLCPTSANLSATLPLHTTGMWSLISGNGVIADSTNPYTYISAMTEGPNVFRWTLTNSCGLPISDDVAVTVYNFTYADAGPDQSVYFSPINPIVVAASAPVATGGNGTYTYQWSPTTNLNDGTAQHPQFSPSAVGAYDFDVTVTDGNGCTASDAVHIDVTKFELLEIPKLITPNNDGINDYLYMPGIESYPYNNLEIYDRLGQLVYKKDGYVNEFTGISSEGMLRNDTQLPQDTYFYILTLEKGKVQKGFFELKR